MTDRYYPHADICMEVESALDEFDLTVAEKIATLNAVIECLKWEADGERFIKT